MKNNRSISVSAPGKLMLMGEHAVVYGYQSIVTAINERIFSAITTTDEQVFELIAPDVGVASYKKPMGKVGSGDTVKGARFVEAALKNFLLLHVIDCGIRVNTKADFSSEFGFGSSSAAVVCVLFGLAKLFDLSMSEKELFDLSYKTVLDVQGKGSGFDVAAAIWGGTLVFAGGGKTIEPLTLPTIPLVIGYTGVKADTTALIGMVNEKKEAYPEKVGRIFEAIEKLTTEGIGRMKEGDWERVGKLMDFNQEYLRDLGVSSEKLESLISAAKAASAWGAKLSGAGGGDCMIALHPDGVQGKLAVEKAITEAGGTVLDALPNAPGVCIETTDNQKELFIVVNKNDDVIGYKTRYECHHDKTLIHRTVAVIVYDNLGRLLLQKRSRTKDTDPGAWGISCAGHVTKGQTDDEAAVRELKEELDIEANLTFLKKVFVPMELESEMDAVYKTIHNGPFVPHPEEIEDIAFFDIPQLQKQVSDGSIVLSQSARLLLKEFGVIS